MIFIVVGTQKFQFNRLLKSVDDLIEKGVINEEVFAQIGYSNYIPQNYKFKRFLDRDDFLSTLEESRIVITHGGTGSIISAIKKRKKVIVVPRLKKFQEHVDNHQLEIVEMFDSLKLIRSIKNIDELENNLNEIDKIEFETYVSGTDKIMNSIKKFINKI